jgi:murein DD-endopeptidase MepM/ murein hydrolase activator NlpD
MAVIRSPAWGDKPFEISQNFGTYDPATAWMYPAEYTEPLGFPAGTHVGLDISMPRNTNIYALNTGKVTAGGPEISEFFRPKPVWIETDDDPNTRGNEKGYVEIYGHLWENFVDVGDRVKPGDLIGKSGQQTIKGTMTPDGTGPHLHFELRKPGEPTSSGFRAINPQSWLVKAGTTSGGDTSEDTPDKPEKPDDTGDTDTSGSTAETVLNLAKEYGPRLVIALVGIGILVIGLRAIV